MYICNCNGIRERDVQAAIDNGASRPADVFRHCQGAPQCAKCVCDLRRMIHSAAAAPACSHSPARRAPAEKAA